MKPLESLNNVERAKLLHALFPQEIPAVVQFVKGMCLTVQEQKQQPEDWGNPLIAYDFWISLARHIERTLEKYGKQLEKSSSLFADQLFDGYNAMFIAYCLIQYTTLRNHENEKFTLAIQLFFAP